MQEKQKRSIVITSVLKPMDDTRMLEKFGMSLLKTNVWDVHIIGFGDKAPGLPSISFHALGYFSRLSITRVFTPWRVLLKLLSIKPVALVITTHELLWVAVLIKALRGTRLYYDVRENYQLNILNTNAFPFALRAVIGFYVRLKEWIFSPAITHFLLAEKCYADELNFIKQRFTVIENKSINPDQIDRKPVGKSIRLLFSGTLDSSTGVFEAIELVKQLQKESPEITLTIIGYAALAEVRKRIQAEAQSNTFIKLIGIDSLVPHSEILKAIRQADAGIIFYQSAPHTKNCIPTKLYEYMAHQLPILYDEAATWTSMITEFKGGISVNFKSPNVKAILTILRTESFYPTIPKDMTWESEEPKLLKALE